MKLFESIESKWEHHCDAGMPELLNFLANEGDEVVTTTRKLSEEVNRRIPYKGVTIGAKQIQKNIDLLIENNYIQREIIGSGYNQRTVYRRGTGRGTAKKKEEIDWKQLMDWYNVNIAVNGRAQWLKVTAKEKTNIRKCQNIANERGQTIGSTLSKVVKSNFLMSWKGLGHYWIFEEDNFTKILDGNYDGQQTADNGQRTAVGGARTAADISRQRSAEQLIALANKRAERGNK